MAAQAAGTGRTRLKAESQGMGGRTWNMRLMSVTLDMSKLSGWLNDTVLPVFCRVERRACHVGRGAGQHTWGGSGASGVHERGPTQALWGPGYARSAQ